MFAVESLVGIEVEPRMFERFGVRSKEQAEGGRLRNHIVCWVRLYFVSIMCRAKSSCVNKWRSYSEPYDKIIQ